MSGRRFNIWAGTRADASRGSSLPRADPARAGWADRGAPSPFRYLRVFVRPKISRRCGGCAESTRGTDASAPG